MNTLTLLVVLIFLTGICWARHLEEKLDLEPSTDKDEQHALGRNHADRTHRRRRRWQMNYGYDYPVPPSPYYYSERKDYDRNQQDLLPRIVMLLEEISAYVKRPPPPPPPPQPIYIPYPVPYPVVQYPSCPDKEVKKPNVTSRFPEMEDTNQNWGFVDSNEEDFDDANDGARPISFEPIKPKRPLQRPAPKVEHGTIQGDNRPPSTEAPKFAESQPVSVIRTPNMCNAAVLSCCTGEKQQQRQCFDRFGCGPSYDNGNACSSDSISAALDLFQAAYAPVQ